ncbi:hypothetical protein [Streptomyces sp. NPDC058424]|uniref:hypothetical protein n=1 Tax=Streptomyces sp. NPDC058424 TaxID=3346491 RepID=UPI0036476A49
MTTLKIAIEAADRDGLLRRSHNSDVTVHAYDVESQRFPYHQFFHGQGITYTVQPDTEWTSPLLPGKLCDTCKDGTARQQQA